MEDLVDYLKTREYPGRGFIIGLGSDNKLLGAYFIMGRSEDSRNRVFRDDGQYVSIVPAEGKEIKNEALLLYRPLIYLDNNIILGNGTQIDEVAQNIKMMGNREEGFFAALQNYEYKQDAPTYTSRISAVAGMDDGSILISIIRKAKNNTRCLKKFYECRLNKGEAIIVHTYEGTAAKPETFSGGPELLKMEEFEDQTRFTNTVWDALNQDYKVSLLTFKADPDRKTVNKEIINRFE